MFGKPTDPEKLRYLTLLERARERQAAFLALPVPKLALLRTRHQQRLWRLDKQIRDLQEVLSSLTK